MDYYIASCVFTTRFPLLSARIQAYIRRRFPAMTVVRCCVPNYKIRQFTDALPEEQRAAWTALPDCAAFAAGDTVYSLCHNCSNIVEEIHPGVQVRSLWELLLTDATFPWPDMKGQRVLVQDCWRSRDRIGEQDAVRQILLRSGFEAEEMPVNRAQTEFCGTSLLRPQPPRNPKLAPKHYAENIEGKFEPHTPEEQRAAMEAFCAPFAGRQILCYCHYCLEGLKLGGAQARHLAEVLFP